MRACRGKGPKDVFANRFRRVPIGSLLRIFSVDAGLAAAVRKLYATARWDRVPRERALPRGASFSLFSSRREAVETLASLARLERRRKGTTRQPSNSKPSKVNVDPLRTRNDCQKKRIWGQLLDVQDDKNE